MNDNQNYYVTRSTSRVLSIPGGKCSIDIFGNDDDDNNSSPTSVITAPSYSPTDATTTNDAVDTTQSSDKPAVDKKEDVAAAAEEARKAEQAAKRNKQRAMGDSFDLFGGDEPSATKQQPTTAATANQTKEIKKTDVSSNQFASSSTTNSYNVITSRPTSRVLQEPGGKSADIIFG